ncbi:MAG: hypothetical protein KJ601_04545 [Nanoarchaeota archaeon]|nr:hypothetical protein [Nanoarchaeota archaeon]MBU1704320.1 hypothetical protein [Nanoarchaeota archaeon]
MDIKPNSRKVVIFYSAIIMGIAIGIAWLIIFFFKTIDLGILNEGLGALGTSIETPNLTQPLIYIALFAVFITLFVTYAKSHTIYEFAADKIVHRNNFLFISLGELDIPYNNVARVSFETKIMNTGNVTIDLSGHKTNQLVMKFIDNPEKVAQDIQNLINLHRANYYSEYTQSQKMDNILDR